MDNQKTNIVYIAQSKIPSNEANSVHVMKMCEALAEQASSVVLLVPEISESPERIYTEYGVLTRFPIKKLAKYKRGSLSFFINLLLVLTKKRGRGSVVISRSLLGSLAAVLTKHNTIFEIHQPVADYGAIHEKIFKWLIGRRKFLAVVVITHGLKRFYSTCYPEIATRLHVLPDAANLNNETNSPSPTVDQATFNVGYAGSLLPGKGAELIPLISRALPGFNFHIIGGDWEQVASLKKCFPYVNNIIYHGQVSHAEVNAKLKSMDVLLAPNQVSVKSVGGKEIGQWTSPLKIFEYMAAGVPIVASDLAVLREVLENGRNCLLCPADDVEAWATAINRLAHDTELARTLSCKAKADLIECYSWRVRAQRMLEIAAPQEKQGE